jgi:hypothetical protein
MPGIILRQLKNNDILDRVFEIKGGAFLKKITWGRRRYNHYFCPGDEALYRQSKTLRAQNCLNSKRSKPTIF